MKKKKVKKMFIAFVGIFIIIVCIMGLKPSP